MIVPYFPSFTITVIVIIYCIFYKCSVLALPIAVASNSTLCPSGFKPFYGSHENASPQQCVTDICQIGHTCHFSELLDTYICCTGEHVLEDKDVCPIGLTLLYQNGDPKQCLTNPCPTGYSCQYSDELKNYVCCGPINVDQEQPHEYIEDTDNACPDGSVAIGKCFENVCGDGYFCETIKELCCHLSTIV